MSKPRDRMPLWKVVVLGAAATVLGVVFLSLSCYVKPAVPATQPSDEAAISAGRLSSLLMLLGMMGVAGTGICIGWLSYRYYLSIPAWKRRKGPPKRR